VTEFSNRIAIPDSQFAFIHLLNLDQVVVVEKIGQYPARLIALKLELSRKRSYVLIRYPIMIGISNAYTLLPARWGQQANAVRVAG
jgi:hypothetical protein